MMSKSELVKKLYEPFALEDHDIRIGSTRNKAQWFVYVRREAITKRLDGLFPLDWDSEITEIKQLDKFATASIRMRVGEAIRTYNGSQNGCDVNSEKGAVTDAFKRVASLFGLGLYLQSAPRIYTNGGFADDNGRVKDWKLYNQQEIEAKNIFANWYRDTFTDCPPVERDNQQQPPTETVNNDDDEWSTWSPDIKKKLVLGLSEVFPGSHHVKLSGYNSLDKKEFEQIGTPRQVARKLIEWNYADANPVVVHYVRYVINSTSGKRYLQFVARLDTENTGHRVINAFGRSTEVKKLLDSVNFYLYAKNGLDAYGFANETTEWEELSIPMTVIYEGGEHLKLAGIIYNGEPSFIADKAVDF